VDTVGFVRDLPHHLVESFKATLEETIHADLLLHVIDSSRPDIFRVREAVEKVLAELGAEQKNKILVFSKTDLLTEERLAELKSQNSGSDAVFVSSISKQGVNGLLDKVAGSLGTGRIRREFFIPKERLGIADFLYREAEVLERYDEGSGSRFTVNITAKAQKRFEAKLQVQTPSDL
jgi:GTP-binding protein HflX